MEITYTSVREPRWADSQSSSILCMVKFNHLKQEVPFIANPNDVQAYGREIFSFCVSEKYGPVGNFEPPPDDQLTTVEGSPVTLVQWPEVEEFLVEANKENASGTTRGQVLVWSSMIEVLVRRVVEGFFADHQVAKDFLGNANTTFSYQIDIAFCLGLITKKEHRTCHSVRKIRNLYAHNWSVTLEVTQLTSSLRSLYQDFHEDYLNWFDDLAFLIRFVFASSCSELASNLVLRQETANASKRSILT